MNNTIEESYMPYKVEYKEGHTNSKGEPAPWVIINNDRDQVVGSSVTKEKAEAAIRARLAGEHGFVKTRKNWFGYHFPTKSKID
jgi:hypothetical protein